MNDDITLAPRKASYRREHPAKGYKVTRRMTHISVSMPHEMIEELRREAIEQRLSFSEVVRNRLTRSEP